MTMNRREGMRRMATGLGALAWGGAQAQAAPRKLVLMSLVGNELTMVSERNSVGSNMNQNERRKLPLQAGVVDTAIGQLMQVAVKKREPAAVTTLVAPSDASLFKDQELWFVTESARLPADVVNDLRATGASQLLLMTKLKADAALRTRSRMAGTGQLEGLGFYVNHTSDMQSGASLNSSLGFLAPYAYVRLALIDLASGRILAQQRLLGAQVVVNEAAGGDTNPWNAIPDAKKLPALLDLVGADIERSVPQLLAAQ